MTARYQDVRYHDQEDYEYFIECDITEKEMESIKTGRYPFTKVIAYKRDKNGVLQKDSPIQITVSVGLLE